MYAPADEYVPQCVPQSSAARGTTFVWALLTLLCFGLLALIFAAPVLSAQGYIEPAGFIYRAFGLLCHQIPERSFHVGGKALAVCARCTGIYAGFATSVLFYPVMRSLKRADSPRRIWLVAASLPIAVDFALGFFGIWQNTHFSRFSTGAIFGAACALYVLPGFLELGHYFQKSLKKID